MKRNLQNRNRTTALIAAGVVAGMVGMAYAAVPLYRIFCQVTGYGGTPKVAAQASPVIGDRIIRVRFNADTARGLPWRFRPVQREVRLRVGETALVFYRAENTSASAVTGRATYNVTPLKAGGYFNKVDCFCFTEQRLGPGETAEMPVSFFVDPAISEDRGLDDVKVITLSYTFFPVEIEAAAAVEVTADRARGTGRVD